MAKELPYFRFTPQEWQNGDISLERFELRGLFIDICSYYWVKDCSITTAMLDKRYSNDKELIQELIDLFIIDFQENEEYIKISFLDNQFDMLSEQRKRRQKAGSKGGKQKSSNAKVELKQKPSYKDKYKDKEKDNIIEIDLIYKSYPSKCPIKNSSTGKSKTDKSKIKKLLSNTSKDDLLFTINTYITECKESSTYIKNFSTFLNNLPDYEKPKEVKLINDGIKRYDVIYDGDPKHYTHSEDEIKAHIIKFATRERSRS